jgi:hypothetical protein
MIQEYRKQLESNDILIGFEFEFKNKKRKNKAKTYEIIKDFIFEHINKLPYDEIYISENYYTAKKDKTVAKPDFSLGDNGIELVTTPTNLKQGLEIMTKTFQVINKFGKTDKDCGFHVNLSFKNTKRNKKIRPTNVPLYINEDYIYKHFPSRRKNQYAKPMHIDLARETQWSWDRTDIECTFDHHMAIDLNKLDGKNKYIEFRYIGGKNYHKQTRQIKTIIGMYIYAMRNAALEKTKKQAKPMAEQLIEKYKYQI